MKFRTIIIEDERAIRDLLVISARLRDHEVFSFPSPVFCALSRDNPCPCGDDVTCCDVLITDQMMPGMTGLEFIELLSKNNCTIRNKALVTAKSSEVLELAERLDCHVIGKPFQVNDICVWLEKSEGNVQPGRRLLQKEVIDS